ncbi:MAG TPA: ABC transporter ATP-binding protein [Candidatus Saccharimonadales bacterium]|nr:ABC transporter ATP-binding protein [Candidatus Saccharimonadales bacterium]
MGATAIHTKGLGKRYGKFWALENCEISVPEGSVSALVGPNGAGKSTLLKILVGLSGASTGESKVLGKQPMQHEDFLSDIGYLAQEIPLYKNLNAEEHIKMGIHLNKRFDEDFIRKRLMDLQIPLDRPVGKLSGGMRAQVALALALAKRPKLLLLDEPVAALDPLARHDFLSSLAQAVADGGLTVVMSSHLLADLERVSDHVIVLAAGRTQLCDDIEQVLKEHKLLVGPRTESKYLDDGMRIIHETVSAKQSTVLVRLDKGAKVPKGWQVHEPNIEEIILAYMGQKLEGGAA